MTKLKLYGQSFIIGLLFFSINTSLAQDRPAPSYISTQELPDSVVNMSLQSINGAEMSLEKILENYKGQKVLVDIWASWCRDCLVTLPKYNILRQQTQNANVAYLLLSIDTDETKWKSTISKFKIEGDHFRIVQGWKNPLSNYIDLDWVPRYMVINEEGVIIEPKSIHIDDKSLYETLMGNKEN